MLKCKLLDFAVHLMNRGEHFQKDLVRSLSSSPIRNRFSLDQRKCKARFSTNSEQFL